MKEWKKKIKRIAKMRIWHDLIKSQRVPPGKSSLLILLYVLWIRVMWALEFYSTENEHDARVWWLKARLPSTSYLRWEKTWHKRKAFRFKEIEKDMNCSLSLLWWCLKWCCWILKKFKTNTSKTNIFWFEEKTKVIRKFKSV